MDTEFLSAAEAAARLGVSVRRVQQMVKSGQLPAKVFGGSFMIRAQDLMFVANRESGRPSKEAIMAKAQFEDFATKHGHKVENGLVSFEQDEKAARAFNTKAQKAGLDTVADFTPCGSYRGADDLSKLPKYWYVRLG